MINRFEEFWISRFEDPFLAGIVAGCALVAVILVCTLVAIVIASLA